MEAKLAVCLQGEDSNTTYFTKLQNIWDELAHAIYEKPYECPKKDNPRKLVPN